MCLDDGCRNTDQPITMEIRWVWQSNPSDLAALGHLPLHKGGFARGNLLMQKRVKT